ncbi:PIN-like domain-containing protein [Kosakonia sacchari]|uniref:PIN-like domain-containing protein n=1 Tax=Kosakonia sacchari TaxID=1158459 RepID=UPI00136211B3|nr:PIN-like domain-containing protein [Kosakonia sacchari]QHM95631.1 hypothetical protein FGE25_15730 [Kosakonia sacchari]
MRKEFCGFYSTSENDLESAWKDTSTIFVLDANCLLNLYRCEDGTREDILRVMQELAPRLWIPFQVGYEYQKNRRNVIHESISSLLKIKEELEKYYKQSILEQAGIKKHLYNILSNELSDFQFNLSESINTFIKSNIETRIKEKENIAEHDFIRDRLDEIINDNIGTAPTQEIINEINKRGDERYENKIPPGFKDGAKKKSISYFSDLVIEDKFGDLYLWEQLIEKASAKEIENVIFVTDDAKEDWVFIHKGINHGPLESLKTEICKRSNLKDFRLINQLSFLREAQRYLVNIAVSNETFEEVKELALTPYNEKEDVFLDFTYDEEVLKIYDFNNHPKKYQDWYKKIAYHSNDKKGVRLFLENILGEFEAVSFRTNTNLELLSNFRTELLETHGEELYISIRKQLLSYYKNATSTANRIRNINSNSLKYDTAPPLLLKQR